jgi:hypothetical protein
MGFNKSRQLAGAVAIQKDFSRNRKLALSENKFTLKICSSFPFTFGVAKQLAASGRRFGVRADAAAE